MKHFARLLMLGIGIGCALCSVARAEVHTIVLNATADTKLDSVSPNRNFGDDSDGSFGYRIGQQSVFLVRFDLSAIPAGSTVQDAFLTLDAASTNLTGPQTFAIWRTLGAWSEMAATWNAPGTTLGTPRVDVEFSGGGTFSADVTSIARQWVENGQPSYGMEVGLSSDYPVQNSAYVKVTTREGSSSRGPKLTVHYVPPTYSLIVDAIGTGGVQIGSSTGHDGQTVYQLAVEAGTPVTLIAPETAGGKPFHQWTGDLTSNDRTISFTMDGPRTLIVDYTPKMYTLSVDAFGASGISIDSASGQGGTTGYSRTVQIGTPVTLTAPSIAGGKNFAGWSGDVGSANRTVSFVMDRDLALTAVYYAPTGWFTNPANGHQYKLSALAPDWPHAEDLALADGGHLATINDAAEQNWIQTTFSPYAQMAFIGFSDRRQEGQWRWVAGDGGTWSQSAGSGTSYTRWNSGEPNNAGGFENYGAILFSSPAGGVWNDRTRDGGAFGMPGLIERVADANAPALRLEDGYANAGRLVAVPVKAYWLSNASAWSFDATFDPGKLTFVRADSGAATGNWTTLAATPSESGTVHISGLAGSGTPVSGPNREICRLIFRTANVIPENGSTLIVPANLTDGLAGSATIAGEIGLGAGKAAAQAWTLYR